MSSDQEGAELSLSPDRISIYACSISLTAEKEDLGAKGINFPRRNTKFKPIAKKIFDFFTANHVHELSYKFSH